MTKIFDSFLFNQTELGKEFECKEVDSKAVFGFVVDPENKKCLEYLQNAQFSPIKSSQVAETTKAAEGTEGTENADAPPASGLAGFQLKYQSYFTDCKNEETGKAQHFVYNINAFCNGVKEPPFERVTNGSYSTCEISTNIYTNYACPFDNLGEISKHVDQISKDVWDFLANLGKWWGAVLIPVGLIMTFLGYKMIQFTFATLIFLTVSLASFLFFVLVIFATSLTTIKIVIVSLLSVVIGGLAVKYLTKYTTKFGVALLAAFGMISLSFVLVPLLGISGSKYANIVKLILYVAAGASGFFGAAYFADGIQVFVTSFIGSYMIVRGVSLYLGGFVNEFEIDSDDQDDLFDDEEKLQWFLGYIVALVIFFVSGIVNQRRLIKK